MSEGTGDIQSGGRQPGNDPEDGVVGSENGVLGGLSANRKLSRNEVERGLNVAGYLCRPTFAFPTSSLPIQIGCCANRRFSRTIVVCQM